jgi:uncharacterized protein with HEPN domain
LSGGLRRRHPDVPWPQIVAFRNILVHAYFGIDWSEVWHSATVECPPLRDLIANIVPAEDQKD